MVSYSALTCTSANFVPTSIDARELQNYWTAAAATSRASVKRGKPELNRETDWERGPDPRMSFKSSAVGQVLPPKTASKYAATTFIFAPTTKRYGARGERNDVRRRAYPSRCSGYGRLRVGERIGAERLLYRSRVCKRGGSPNQSWPFDRTTLRDSFLQRVWWLTFKFGPGLSARWHMGPVERLSGRVVGPIRFGSSGVPIGPEVRWAISA